MPEDVEQHQREARNQGADEEVGNGNRIRGEVSCCQLGLLISGGDLVAEQDQHDRRWDDLAECAGRANRAAGDRRRIAAAQHGRQGQQPHGHHGGADDTGRSGEQGTDDGDRDAEAAAHAAHYQRHGLQQLFRQSRSLEHHPHEDEQRHRNQQVVGHDAVDAIGQGLHEGELKNAEGGTAEGVDQGHARKREGDRKAKHQRPAERQDHGRNDQLVNVGVGHGLRAPARVLQWFRARSRSGWRCRE